MAEEAQSPRTLSLPEAQDLSAKQQSFASLFYDKINDVLGGTSSSEKLCLLLPGISLSKSDFAYDYANGESKGSTIEKNESNLANKLYDPYDMVGADNGKTLPNQYRSALNSLLPKLNPAIAKAKNEIRSLLLKPYPYTFKDEKGNAIDTGSTHTLQEVFFRLYDDYVATAEKWALEKTKWRADIEKKHEGIADEKTRNKKIDDDYLAKYENEAESWINKVNQKMSALLSVFTLNDMRILEGILDSGVGAELQEARQTLNNTQKLTPEGNYVFPVKFNPTNWFDYLDTKFTPMDLLNSPNTMQDELDLLYSQRNSIAERIQTIGSLIPSDATLTAQKKAVETAKTNYDKNDLALTNAMEDGCCSLLKNLTTSICNACIPAPTASNAAEVAEKTEQAKTISKEAVNSSKEAIIAEAAKKMDDSKVADNEDVKKLQKEANAAKDDAEKDNSEQNNNALKDAEKKLEDGKNKAKEGLAQTSIDKIINGAFDTLFSASKEVSAAQTALTSALDNYTSALCDYAKSKNLENFKNELEILKNRKTTLDEKIKNTETKLMEAAIAVSSQTDNDDVNPPEIPEGFSQLTIIHDQSISQEYTFSKTTTTTKSTSAGFWIFKKRKTETSVESEFEQICESADTSIRIGMNVAKVGIEREWFNPGVFNLTQDMFSLANEKISIDVTPNNATDRCKCIFPCYPTAMVIACDVTVKIKQTNNSSVLKSNESSKQTATSKGFFVFNSSDGTKTETSEQASSTQFLGNTITLRFATPQIIGFYLQATPTDHSAKYNVDDTTSDELITNFIKAYSEVIESRNAINAKA